MKDTIDPQITQELRASTMKYDEAFNKNDAASIAALFTEDAVQVSPQGLIFGRQAIEKKYADLFQHGDLATKSGFNRSIASASPRSLKPLPECP